MADCNKNPFPETMKILLMGASGLLGHCYALAAIRRRHQVTGLFNTQVPKAKGFAETVHLNAHSLEELQTLCLDIWPDAIVNCAAISNPGSVEANPQAAHKINVDLPRTLAQLSMHLGARLIHISTDMVFDGKSQEPYRSTDMPAPTNLYGQTKLMAEREVLEHNTEDPVVLRLPILMGNSPGGQRSLHEKLIQAVQSGETPKLFCDEIRQPCSVSNAAEVMLELTESRKLHGIFHWAGNEPLSRFEMGQRILKHFNLPEDTIEPIQQEDATVCTNRPANLSFNLYPLVSKLKTRPLNFKAQLEELTRIEPLNA